MLYFAFFSKSLSNLNWKKVLILVKIYKNICWSLIRWDLLGFALRQHYPLLLLFLPAPPSSSSSSSLLLVFVFPTSCCYLRNFGPSGHRWTAKSRWPVRLRQVFASGPEPARIPPKHSRTRTCEDSRQVSAPGVESARFIVKACPYTCFLNVHKHIRT